MNSIITPALASPCTRVCQLDGDEICIGCFRTKSEIAGWSRMNDTEKSAVNVAAKERGQNRRRHEPGPN
jgi:hypothetical protein